MALWSQVFMSTCVLKIPLSVVNYLDLLLSGGDFTIKNYRTFGPVVKQRSSDRADFHLICPAVRRLSETLVLAMRLKRYSLI